jgi:hypothetical protein
MKTELKFRAFDTLQGGKFEYWDAKTNKYDGIFWTMIQNKSFKEPQQYSTIKDKNGKEIYVGDIFKLGAEKEVFEVRFEHGCFMAFCKGKQYGLIGELQICFIDVIGNVHQNAGLL